MRFLSRQHLPLARVISLSVVPFSLALAASAVLVQNAPLVAQETTSFAPSIRDVILLAISGDGERATLSEGEASGVRVGSVFTLSEGGVVRAKLRVVRVRDNDSVAELFDVDRDFLVTVGEKAEYFTYEAPAIASTPPSSASPTSSSPSVSPSASPTPLDVSDTAPDETDSASATPTPTVIAAPTPESSDATAIAVDTSGSANTSSNNNSSDNTDSSATSSTPSSTPSSGDTSSTTVTTSTTTTTSATATNASVGWTNVRVTGIEGSKVTLGAGLSSGIKTGVNLPVWQEGSVVAILRVLSSQANSSVAQLTWSDVAAGGLNVGDIVRIENTVATVGGTAPNAATNSGVLVADVTNNGGNGETSARPLTPVLYETGASNFSVPRADRTYEYLASLAASGLIKSQPADVFHDDGVRRHRTEEDTILTRAQIAAFVVEALSNVEDEIGGRDSAALSFLANEYSKDLRALGVTSERIAELTRGGGFKLGVSGVTRLTFGGGGADGDDIEYLPFSEPKGGTRTRSGYDVRTNLFGDISKNLKFFATIDGGTRPQSSKASLDGTDDLDTNDSGFEVRRALISYDAKSLLRGLSFEVGRNENWWGVGRYGTTFLGDNNPLNTVRTRFERGSYSLDTIYSPLGRGPSGEQRSLYARKLELKVGKQSRFGFYEALLVPTTNFDAVSFLATYVPLPIRAVQKIRGKNVEGDQSQSVVALYGETAVARGTRLYGELLIDDIATTPDNPNRNRIGTLFGLQLFNPRDITKAGVNIEYTNLQARTYFPIRYEFDQTLDYNYFQNGASLGYPVAPDPLRVDRGGAESLRFEFYWKPIKKLRLNAGLEFADRGSEEDVVARQQVARLRATYDLSSNFALSARIQNIKTRNPLNVEGVSSTQRFFQLQVSRSF